jgi:transposase
MAKPLSDDLRCRILQAYERKEGSRRQLALRFKVSLSMCARYAGSSGAADAWNERRSRGMGG